MDVLLSQLAQTAAKERALLEECGDLLSVAATLEVTNMHPIYRVHWQVKFRIGTKSTCPVIVFFLGFFRKALKQSEVKFTKS
jgi:hypothetical protein